MRVRDSAILMDLIEILCDTIYSIIKYVNIKNFLSAFIDNVNSKYSVYGRYVIRF